VFPIAPATNLLGVCKAIQAPSVGRPVRAPHTPRVPRRAACIYKFPQLNRAAPPAQAASSPLPSLLLRVASPRRRAILAIREGLPPVRRQLLRVIPSKTSSYIFLAGLLCTNRIVLVDVTIGSWRSTKMGVGRYLLRNCVRVLGLETCEFD
jgi:hypothetical protein